MPGVPSGRGCEACRQQKKKCDQSKPACSRCSRLQLVCAGSGVQRYKFKEDQRSIISSSHREALHRARDHLQEDATRIPFPGLNRAPSNATTLLTSALVGKLNSRDDLRYHLTWTYGDFFDKIPKRLGNNAALDTAVAALVSAHSHLGLYRNSKSLVPSESIMKYSRALRTLRVYLESPAKARETETLCAVMLLMICQAFLGTSNETSHRSLNIHSVGAAQIIKARANYPPQDDLEYNLLLTLRGPVLCEALVNDNVSFSQKEWGVLTKTDESEVAQSHPEQIMRCLGTAPDLMRRGRSIRSNQADSQVLIAEARYQYDILNKVLVELRNNLNSVREVFALQPPIVRMKIHSHYQRLYGLGLMGCLAFNCILKGLSTGTLDQLLETESRKLCRETLQLADEATIYRPLGASYVSACLILAWCSSSKAEAIVRTEIKSAILDYRSDFPGEFSTMLEPELEFVARRLSLATP